jgi:peptidoglycan/LPS O-acetylase OafA/YrhL
MYASTAHPPGQLAGSASESASAGNEKPRWHAPGLDVLRFLCFLAVWELHNLGHLPQTERLVKIVVDAFAFGGFGVVGFFTLSSYLITRLLLMERASTGRIRLGAYWWRRILRIWPLYYLLLAGTAIASAIGIPGAVVGGSTPYYLTFTLNWAASLMHLPPNSLGHTWSIGVEEQAYLILPLLAVLGATGRWRVLVFLAALGPLARLIAIQLHLPGSLLWNATTSHLDVIVIGAMLAVVQQHHGRVWGALERLLAGRRGLMVLTTGLVLLMLCTLLRVDLYFTRLSTVSYLLVSLLTTAAIVVALGARCVGRPSRMLAWLGRRTYGLYMFHWPVLLSLEAVDMHLGRTFGPAELILSLTLTVALAVVSYELFEKRFLALRRRFQWVVSDRVARTR